MKSKQIILKSERLMVGLEGLGRVWPVSAAQQLYAEGEERLP